MGITESGNFNDVLNNNYQSTVLTVTTTQIEAKVNTNRMIGRQVLLLYNDSSNTVYFGPTGVTSSGINKGIPLEPGDFLRIQFGDVGLFLIVASGSSNVIVQELA